MNNSFIRGCSLPLSKAVDDVLNKNIAELELRSGKGVTGQYINKLGRGTEEQRVLAEILIKTLAKPKFTRYIQSNKLITNNTNILDAVVRYIQRKKPDDKVAEALLVLRDNDYSVAGRSRD